MMTIIQSKFHSTFKKKNTFWSKITALNKRIKKNNLNVVKFSDKSKKKIHIEMKLKL